MSAEDHMGNDRAELHEAEAKVPPGRRRKPVHAPPVAQPYRSRRARAWHEAGHAVVAERLGHVVEVVSILPGAHYGGVSIDQTPDLPFDRLDVDVPVVVQDPELRRGIERKMVILLAGAIAEDFIERRAGYIEQDADELVVERTTRALATTSPRGRDLLADADVPTGGDLASTLGLAHGFAYDEAIPYYALLDAIARRLVAECAPEIERVALALMEADVLEGDAVRALIHPPKEAPVPILARRGRKAVEYVATGSVVGKLDGRDVSLTSGVTRVRESHPARVKWPHLFEEALTAGKLVEPRPVPVVEPYRDPQFRILQPIPPERRVRAIRHLFVGYAIAAFAGQVYDARSDLVKRNSAYFEPVPPTAGAKT